MMLSDRVSGGALVALGALAFIGGSRQLGVPGQDIGPAVFPMVVGAGLALCGALVALGIGRGFEVPEEPDRSGWLQGMRALVPPALLLVYVLLADRAGFLIAAAVIVLLTSLALGARWRLAIPMAIIAPPLVHLVFYKLLRVPLPEGILAAPWI